MSVRVFYRGLEIETDVASAPALMRWIESDRRKRAVPDALVELEQQRSEAVELALRISEAMAKLSDR